MTAHEAKACMTHGKVVKRFPSVTKEKDEEEAIRTMFFV